MAYDTGFAISPETPGDRFVVRLNAQGQFVPGQQNLNRGKRHIRYNNDITIQVAKNLTGMPAV